MSDSLIVGRGIIDWEKINPWMYFNPLTQNENKNLPNSIISAAKLVFTFGYSY